MQKMPPDSFLSFNLIQSISHVKLHKKKMYSSTFIYFKNHIIEPI